MSEVIKRHIEDCKPVDVVAGLGLLAGGFLMYKKVKNCQGCKQGESCCTIKDVVVASVIAISAAHFIRRHCNC